MAGRVFRVCARLFSQQLQRALPDRDLDVRLLLLPPLPFDIGVQFVQTGLQARESGLHGPSVSTGSAVSRGPDADVGMFPDAIVATPAFLSPAVGGFLLGVSATGALLLEPVRVPRQQRALAGIAELADHVGGAAFVFDVQPTALSRCSLLYFAMRGFSSRSGSPRKRHHLTPNTFI